MRKPGFHKHRVEAKILDDLNSFLRFSMNDSRLRFVSVTRISLKDDYSTVEVYWDTFDREREGQVAVAMSAVRGRLQGLLGKTLSQTFKMKAVPRIEVKYDTQFCDEQRISELLASS